MFWIAASTADELNLRADGGGLTLGMLTEGNVAVALITVARTKTEKSSIEIRDMTFKEKI
jgi:hypothetical protein